MQRSHGVTHSGHAIQQGVNHICAGSVVVIDGIEDFLIHAGAVCLQIVGLEQRIQMETDESQNLAVCLSDQLLDSAGSSMRVP